MANRSPSSPWSPIILITGASGAGKSTVRDRLLADKSLPAVKFITCTTRAKRPGERDGRDYWFFDHDTFTKKIEAGEMYEWALVYDNYYGSSKGEMERLAAKKKAILMVVDVQGMRTLKKAHPEAIAIFLDAPLRSLEHRLEGRGTDPKELSLRLRAYAKEEKARKLADHVIVNRDGQLRRTLATVRKIILSSLRNGTPQAS